jgi:N-acetylglucosamine kinase-like BadF-type ATPase
MLGPYFLGLDGGGHKTLGLLMDAAGAVLACDRGLGSAIGPDPAPERCAVLRELQARVCAQAGIPPTEVAQIGLGLSGIDFEDEFAHQHRVLSEALRIPGERLILVNDGVVALWGASPADSAAIVHHGSGVTHAYRAGFGTERPFDHLDAGRLFDLRHEVAAAVARMIDGRLAPTPLKDAVLRHYGLTEDTFADHWYRQRIPREVFRTAHIHVWEGWLHGDPAATHLVEQAAADYIVTACALIRHTGNPQCEVAFGGGVLNHAPDRLLELLAEGVRAEFPHASVLRPRLSPAHGAALMAAFHAGLDPRPLYARMLNDSLSGEHRADA